MSYLVKTSRSRRTTVYCFCNSRRDLLPDGQLSCGWILRKEDFSLYPGFGSTPKLHQAESETVQNTRVRIGAFSTQLDQESTFQRHGFVGVHLLDGLPIACYRQFSIGFLKGPGVGDKCAVPVSPTMVFLVRVVVELSAGIDPIHQVVTVYPDKIPFEFTRLFVVQAITEDLDVVPTIRSLCDVPLPIFVTVAGPPGSLLRALAHIENLTVDVTMEVHIEIPAGRRSARLRCKTNRQRGCCSRDRLDSKHKSQSTPQGVLRRTGTPFS